jgi:exonuclease III
VRVETSCYVLNKVLCDNRVLKNENNIDNNISSPNIIDNFYKRDPLSFITWNVNGLLIRWRKGEMKLFVAYIFRQKTDVVALQEVRLKAVCSSSKNSKDVPLGYTVAPVSRNELSNHIDSKDCQKFSEFFDLIDQIYYCYFALVQSRYAGQMLLVSHCMMLPRVTFGFEENSVHVDGRIIIAKFQNLIITSVYMPNKGDGNIKGINRKREWHRMLCDGLTKQMMHQNDNRMLLGDLNAISNSRDV